MALNINKGGRINITKEAPKLKVAGIGLGWEPNMQPNGPDFDLDVSAFLLTTAGKIPIDNQGNSVDSYVVFYGSELKVDTQQGQRPYSGDGSVVGAVDAIDGTESDGADDEDMRIYFDKVWEGIEQIVITVSITKYPNDSKRDKRTLLQNFGMVNDCYIRVWDDESGTEILRYNLSEQFFNEDAVEFGRFVRINGAWEFIATGNKYTGGLAKLIELYA